MRANEAPAAGLWGAGAGGEPVAFGALHHPDDRADPGHPVPDGHLAGRARRDRAAGHWCCAVLCAPGRDRAARG
ncbi:hypothetical protein G6F40_017848 [Rhizopus arrhizus]|nr:hypothetical protein G6F40_017848 [Rhizopus arrhizus]